MSKLSVLMVVVVVLCIGVIAGVLITGGGDESSAGGGEGARTTESRTVTSTTVEEPPKGEDPQALRGLATAITLTRRAHAPSANEAAIADQLRYLTVLDEVGQTLSVAADRTVAVARTHRVRRSRALPQRQRLSPLIERLRSEADRLSAQSERAKGAGIRPRQLGRVARQRSVLITVLDDAAAQLERQQRLPDLTPAAMRIDSPQERRRIRAQRRLEIQRAGRIAQRTAIQLERTGRQIRIRLKRAVLRAANVDGHAGGRVLRRLTESLASLPPGWPLYPPLRCSPPPGTSVPESS